MGNICGYLLAFYMLFIIICIYIKNPYKMCFYTKKWTFEILKITPLYYSISKNLIKNYKKNILVNKNEEFELWVLK